jgi:predicted component of viral defense system (DUF524 family)
MVLLASIEGQDWRVEVRGRALELPSFVGSEQAVSKIAGSAVLQIFPPNGSVVSIQDGVVSHQPILFENSDYDICFKRSSGAAIKLEIPPSASIRYEDDRLTIYAINFRNDVGFFDLVISDSSTVRVTLEVFPTKLDYRSDYVQMRDEVAALARNLVLTVQARTYSLATPSPAFKPTLAEWSSLLRSYFSALMKIGNAIVAMPHNVLTRRVDFVPIEKLRRLDHNKLRSIMQRQIRKAGGLSFGGVLLPARLPQLNRGMTYDTPENRHIKYLLSRIAFRLQQIVRVTSTGDEDADQTAEQRFFDEFRPIAREMLREVERLQQTSFLKEIRSVALAAGTSQVLQKHPTYSAFARTARVLSGGLSATGGVLTIGIKHIAELYEYWCFLKLVALLRERFELTQQTIVKLKDTGIVVTLEKGKQSAVRFNSATGERIELIYNRSFTKLPTLAQKPDNVIQLTNGRTFHILDAKYRVASDPEYQKQFGGCGPRTDDINTMHRYRDAIVLPESLGGGGYCRGVVKDAVVLFPFKDEEGYRQHRFYKSIAEVQIGGLPLLPNTSSLLEEHLLKLLQTDGVVTLNDGQNQP